MGQDAEALPPKGDTAERISFSGKVDSYPAINGYNLFTGEFTGKSAAVGLVVSDQSEWEQAWAALGKKPPGPLPPESRAVIEAFKKSPRDPAVAFMPKTIDIKSGKETVIHIDWTCIIIGKEEDKDAKPRYAVLLLPPKGMLKAKFNDVWPYREKKKRLDQFNENIKAFKRGQGAGIPAPSRAEFKKKTNPKMARGR